MPQSESRSVVWIALLGNAAITACKFIAALVTGSSAMLSEGVHSLADTGNELLMLYGIKRAGAPADTAHPFGHGREAYFWSFIVAVLILVLGAGVSFYHGIARLRSAEPIEHVAANYVVLAISFVFEGISWTVALRRLRGTKGEIGYFEAMRKSKDPTVFTVLLEDSAALIGLVIAGVGIALAHATGSTVFDALASLGIAALLCVTSYFLARETKALLIGEPAAGTIQRSIVRIASRDEAVAHANGVVTAQLGPDHIFAALSAEFRDDLNTPQIEACVERLESAVKAAHPDVVAVFVKPQKTSVWESKRAALTEAH